MYYLEPERKKGKEKNVMHIFVYIYDEARLYEGKLKHIGIPNVTTCHKYMNSPDICYTI